MKRPVAASYSPRTLRGSIGVDDDAADREIEPDDPRRRGEGRSDRLLVARAPNRARHCRAPHRKAAARPAPPPPPDRPPRRAARIRPRSARPRPSPGPASPPPPSPPPRRHGARGPRRAAAGPDWDRRVPSRFFSGTTHLIVPSFAAATSSCGEDREHAGRALRRRTVDAPHARMGMRRAQERGVRLARPG